MEIMGVLRHSQTSPTPEGCHHSGSGNWTVAHMRLWVSGPGRGGPQAVVCSSEGTYSILNTAVKEVGTLWSQCGRARKLGHLARRFPEETPIFRSLRRMGHGPGTHWEASFWKLIPSIMLPDHRSAAYPETRQWVLEKATVLHSDKPGFSSWLRLWPAAGSQARYFTLCDLVSLSIKWGKNSYRVYSIVYYIYILPDIHNFWIYKNLLKLDLFLKTI